MKRIIINGKFLSENMQGIVRYAGEIVSALDRQLKKEDRVWIVVPQDARDIPQYEHIKVIKYGSRKGILWEQTDFRRFALHYEDSVLLNLCNTSPMFAGTSVTAVHDIMYRVNPSNYTTLRNRVSRLWHIFQYNYLFRHEKYILTVSRFSARETARFYRCARGKIRLIPDAWQHVRRYKESPDWQTRWPELESGQYFFSLATLARNKNGKWIIETAKRNPGHIFAMAGNIYETEYDELPENVRLLGYVTDEEACALIRHCRAFLFPSLYEGFGLPPVEALALGAEVISSDTTSLPEVLGGAVHYIDPYRYDYELDALLKEPVSHAKETLDRYGWNRSAHKLLKLLETI